MEKIIDLHVHSTFSDGTFTPEEIIKVAKEKNLSALALTDHDNIGGYEEFYKYGKENNIETICGIEFSTSAGIPAEVHIVGLFLDHKNNELNEKIKELSILRKDRNRKMIQKFKDLGINISEEELRKESKGSIVTKCHYANILYKRGIVSSISEAFDVYLHSGKPADVKRVPYLSEKAIDLIHRAGGIAVLAHPTLYKLDYDGIYELASRLKNSGLDAIEILYSTYTEEQSIKVKEIADKLSLLYSGGSDFHGTNKPKISLGSGHGNLKIPYEILDNLKKHLK